MKMYPSGEEYEVNFMSNIYIPHRCQENMGKADIKTR